ncbi:unnamed protein product, partial [Polarella glacialis]
VHRPAQRAPPKHFILGVDPATAAASIEVHGQSLLRQDVRLAGVAFWSSTGYPLRQGTTYGYACSSREYRTNSTWKQLDYAILLDVCGRQHDICDGLFRSNFHHRSGRPSSDQDSEGFAARALESLTLILVRRMGLLLESS